MTCSSKGHTLNLLSSFLVVDIEASVLSEDGHVHKPDWVHTEIEDIMEDSLQAQVDRQCPGGYGNTIRSPCEV